MEEKVGTYRLTAEPFHVDFTGRITLGVLGNQMLNCAGQHATRRGFGMRQLLAEGYTWVLSRLAMEMDDLPRQYEEYTVQTWIESVSRLFTMRCFAVLDANGRPIGYTRSIWAMIDQQTRRPADLFSLRSGHIADYACPQPCPIQKPGHLRAVDTEAVDELRVRYSDIDTNGHVNSMRYLDHVLDLFPLDHYRHWRVSRLEIAYMAESHFGDRLTLHVDERPALALSSQAEAADAAVCPPPTAAPAVASNATANATQAAPAAQVATVEIRRQGLEPVCRCRLTFAGPTSEQTT